MLDWCVKSSGSVCFYSFFLSVLVSIGLLSIACFQYWAEKRNSNVILNLPYYMRRANLLAPFGIIAFAIKIVSSSVHLYSFSDFLINSNNAILILILGFMCHYCITAIREINRLPPSRRLRTYFIAITASTEILLIIAISLQNRFDKYWPTLLIYIPQMTNLFCIPVVIVYQSRIIFSIVRKNTQSMPAKAKNTSTTSNQLVRWKTLLIFTAVLSSLGVCAEAYFTYTAYLRFGGTFTANRNPANPYTVTLQCVCFIISVWYAWIPFNPPKNTDSSNIPTQLSREAKPIDEVHSRSCTYPRMTAANIDSPQGTSSRQFFKDDHSDRPQNIQTTDDILSDLNITGERTPVLSHSGRKLEDGEDLTPRSVIQGSDITPRSDLSGSLPRFDDNKTLSRHYGSSSHHSNSHHHSDNSGHSNSHHTITSSSSSISHHLINTQEDLPATPSRTDRPYNNSEQEMILLGNSSHYGGEMDQSNRNPEGTEVQVQVTTSIEENKEVIIRNSSRESEGSQTDWSVN